MSIAAPRRRTPGAHPLRRAYARSRTPLLAVAVLAWVVAGLAGLWRYVENYSIYRGFPPPVTPHGIAKGSVQTVHFWSRALHARRDMIVYLPPGYAAAAARGHRYPVLYILHGHPGRPSNIFEAGSLAPEANILIGRGRMQPMIIVAPSGRNHGTSVTDEWANGAAGPYESMLLDAVHATDARYATIADRGHRVIAGLSEGGYGAANIALRHVRMFGGFESWSGYFAQTPTGTFAGASAATLYANSPQRYVGALAPQIRRLKEHAYIYVGARDHRDLVRARAFESALAAAGVQAGSGVFPGGHDWGLWRAQLPHMLRVASAWMPTRGSAP
jgi:enterochelin esterase-like enzyme